MIMFIKIPTRDSENPRVVNLMKCRYISLQRDSILLKLGDSGFVSYKFDTEQEAQNYYDWVMSLIQPLEYNNSNL